MLETHDLILKSGNAADWMSLYRNFWRHEEVFRFMFRRACDSEESARKRTEAYAQMHQEVDTEFFVYEKSTGQAIGIAGIKEMGPGIFTVTDIAIGPAFSGRGFGKQILAALIKLAFEECNALQLHYDCFEQNEISKRLALSCGFKYTHTEQAELLKNGESVKLAYYILNQTDR